MRNAVDSVSNAQVPSTFSGLCTFRPVSIDLQMTHIRECEANQAYDTCILTLDSTSIEGSVP